MEGKTLCMRSVLEESSEKVVLAWPWRHANTAINAAKLDTNWLGLVTRHGKNWKMDSNSWW